MVAQAQTLRYVMDAVRIWRRDDAAATADKYRAEKRFFGFSILYLFLHFVLLLAEATLRAVGLGWQGWPVLS